MQISISKDCIGFTAMMITSPTTIPKTKTQAPSVTTNLRLGRSRTAVSTSSTASKRALIISETSTGLKDFGGWYDGEFRFFQSKKANEAREEIFCKPSVGAFTIEVFQSITWCPNAFSGFSNGFKYVTSIGGIKADQKQIKKDDPLNKYESLASVWLHEWTHLHSSTDDQPAYDKSGNSISGKSYGFFNCVNLARKGQSLAVANADTFAYFAMAMYLESWDWSNGFAENSLGM